MGYIGVITHLLTIDPNFRRDIQMAVDRTFDPDHAVDGDPTKKPSDTKSMKYWLFNRDPYEINPS